MKRFLTLALAAVMAFCGLSGCGCDDGSDVDLVFVNGSDATIIAVVADFEDRSSGTQNADSSPLKRGETFGFEAGAYPVTVTAYGDVELREELARITVREAPRPGERWYVTARGSGGLILTVDSQWPEGV